MGQDHNWAIGCEGEKVVLSIDGRRHEIPWDIATRISKAIYAKSKQAEEFAKVHQIINDGAILLRAGVPIGLTDNPKIQTEIRKEAAWNRDLRRFMPGGVKSEEQIGTPTVTQSPPPQHIRRTG